MSKVTRKTAWDVDTLGEFRREDQGDGTVAIWLVGFVFVAPNGITATVGTDEQDSPSWVGPPAGTVYGYTLDELADLPNSA